MIEQYYTAIQGLGYEAVHLPEGQCSGGSWWHHRQYDTDPKRVFPPGGAYGGQFAGKDIYILQSHCGDNPRGEPFFYVWIYNEIVPIATFGLTIDMCPLESEYDDVPGADSTQAGALPVQTSAFGIDQTTMLLIAAAGLAAYLVTKK
jgi:hypothetical protein